MDAETVNGTKHYREALSQTEIPDDILQQITSKPKRQYSPQEIEEARGKLAFMNDRVFFITFKDNKNNHIITGTVNALRKIHFLADIPPIERTTVQSPSLYEVLGRGMVGDLTGKGESINITLEAQRDKQDGFAVRGTLTSGNVMRMQWSAGKDYTEAPDVIGINILGFCLPELAHRKMFFSRIVRAEYESKEPFLADKYSDYYIELPKLKNFTKAELPEEYHDLWDLCCIFKTQVKDYGEVIRMQNITNQVALDLSSEVTKTVATNELVNETIDRKTELEQLREYLNMREQKAAQSAEQKGKEQMLIMAIQSNVTPEAIETMQKGAGISDARLAELKKQAQLSQVV